MARSRNIKPSFFTNDLLCSLSPLTRLLFAGLWCHADRKGRIEDRARKIKALVLPYDECNVEDLLFSLDATGFIERYQVENVSYIQIVNFTKHQKPHAKESDSLIPEKNHDLGSGQQRPRRLRATKKVVTSRALTLNPLTLTINPISSLNACADQPVDNSVPEKIPESIWDRQIEITALHKPFPENFEPTEDHKALASGYEIDLAVEIDKARNYALSNCKVSADWGAYFKNWLHNAHKFSQSRGTKNGSQNRKPTASEIHWGQTEDFFKNGLGLDD